MPPSRLQIQFNVVRRDYREGNQCILRNKAEVSKCWKTAEFVYVGVAEALSLGRTQPEMINYVCHSRRVTLAFEARNAVLRDSVI